MKVLLYVHPSKVWLAGHSNHNYGEETEEKEELGL